MAQIEGILGLQSGTTPYHHPEGRRSAVPYGYPVLAEGSEPVFGIKPAAPYNHRNPMHPWRQKPIDNSGNPARICCAPIDVIPAKVMNPFGSDIDAYRSPVGMQYPTGLAFRA